MNSFEDKLKELDKLNLPIGLYAIFGSGPLAIRKIRDSKDIDIIVKEELWIMLSKSYPVLDNGSIRIGFIEIFKDWLPWFSEIDSLIDDADVIENHRYVKLKYVLKWKKAYAREKDIKDVKLIKEYLSANKN